MPSFMAPDNFPPVPDGATAIDRLGNALAFADKNAWPHTNVKAGDLAECLNELRDLRELRGRLAALVVEWRDLGASLTGITTADRYSVCASVLDEVIRRPDYIDPDGGGDR